MSGTALDHPLVRDYLQELDRALTALPAAQASELTEQITAHLDDALAPDTGDEEIAAVLSRLGRPADLAAEALTGIPKVRRRWLRRLGWRGWVTLAAAVLVAGAVTGYLVTVLTTAPVQFAGTTNWWYPQDSGRQVFTSADGAQQDTVPIRSGRLQSIVFTVQNPSDWTQTVLSVGPDSAAPGNALHFQIGVSTTDPWGAGGYFTRLRYALPESIPPHQIRWMRLTWVSTVCLPKGADSGIDQLPIRVRVGLVSRTETLSFDMGFYLSGPSHGTCD
jgi:hypothetical protein